MRFSVRSLLEWHGLDRQADAPAVGVEHGTAVAAVLGTPRLLNDGQDRGAEALGE